MKYCKDCKHYVKRARWQMHDRCNRKNLVDADCINQMSRLCYLQREDGWLMARYQGTCGREGRFYEPKETTPETPDVTTTQSERRQP